MFRCMTENKIIPALRDAGGSIEFDECTPPFPAEEVTPLIKAGVVEWINTDGMAGIYEAIRLTKKGREEAGLPPIPTAWQVFKEWMKPLLPSRR